MLKNKRRRFDKSLLPPVLEYYQQQFANLKIKPEWTAVHCPFHEDKKPSLSINLMTGGFYCFGCNIKCGDIIAFHMQRYQLSFVDTVSYFKAWRYEGK